MIWLLRAFVVLVSVYVVSAGAVAVAMLQPPERFGAIMTRVPVAMVWAVLPGRQIWTWARSGDLRAGDAAPDFTLSTYDHTSRVTLSSHRGQRPVVLVFGSYT